MFHKGGLCKNHGARKLGRLAGKAKYPTLKNEGDKSSSGWWIFFPELLQVELVGVQGPRAKEGWQNRFKHMGVETCTYILLYTGTV